MQKMRLLIILLTLSVSGCTTPLSWLSRCNDCPENREAFLQCQEKNRALQEDLAKMQRKMVDLENKSAHLQENNAFLYRQTETLRRTINRQKSVISLHKTVIRLFDDSNQSMQKNIDQQLAAQQNGAKLPAEADTWVFANDTLFVSGTTDLSAEGIDTLKEVAGELKQRADILVMVEGHADNRPLKKTACYADNWELSALRAAAVVAFLQQWGGVPPENLRAVGCGYYQPLTSNQSPAGRRRNSRVEIRVESRP